MPSPTLAAGPSTALPPLAPAIRTGVALLAVAAFALSYDALRQMAAASHIHPALTYAFPLVIDVFIGIGSLLVLRTAPLSARLYVSALVGIATATSIWANVLHAIRLNQQNRRSALALDDLTVGAISAIAPLALAGAVHLYLLVQRRPTRTKPRPEPHNDGATSPEDGVPPTPAQVPDADVAKAPAMSVSQPTQPRGKRRGRPSATFEQAVEIGRTAPLGRGGQISRRHIEAAVHANGLGIGRSRLDEVKNLLQAELGQARTTA
ncbi:DUF2637 domain-containing protein [Streptomyces sp. ITFR-6]|uniref:DUF2637 domain-containing protein n=1 Tax=Streptomyces sp. ITFR-6 TaxID=3075197 RepID=UPI00288B6C7F|nr:DUF2637 domain-containing protein [Streptomyces sp. ITFR-6]WNI30807.1 DUF2637 domain-containing protein [Streptomyces sp. ITFR-6]